jgi:hypothetical protein
MFQCVIDSSLLPRKTTWDIILGDKLTRSSTMSRQVSVILEQFGCCALPGIFVKWLAEPDSDFELGYKLLEFVKNK